MTLICCDYKCNWKGSVQEVLSADNPFVEGKTMYACPKCFGINALAQVSTTPLDPCEYEMWKNLMQEKD